MKIWLLQEDVNNFEHLTLADANDELWNEFSSYFNGESIESNWKALRLKIIEHSGTLSKSDVPYLSPGVLVFSREAINTLQKYLKDNAEILCTEGCEGNYRLINVIKLIDGIDYKKSRVEYYSDKKRIMAIDKYAFFFDKVKEQHIFKIKELPKADVFVSDDFRRKVIESGLKGFKFIEVWDSSE